MRRYGKRRRIGERKLSLLPSRTAEGGDPGVRGGRSLGPLLFRG